MEHFKKLYISGIENVSEEIANTMIMCGSSNWDFYFMETENNSSEMLENVTLIEFDSEDGMNNFIVSNPDVIDYSLEHESPCVLIKDK